MALLVPFAGLTILPGKGIQADAANIAAFDAGAVNPLDHSTIRAEFTLRNDGKTPLSLDRLQAGCHCTSAVVEQVNGVRVDFDKIPALDPGRQATVQVILDLSGQPAGDLLKIVSVYLKGNPRPAAQLQIRASLTPIVSFAPARLDFGHLPYGEAKTETVTVSVDRRLMAGEDFPALVSTNPSVQITPAVLLVPHSPSAFGASRLVTRVFQVAVAKDSALGPISGSLLLSAPKKASPTQQTALASVNASLLGQVSGDLSASPAVLAFGAVNYGRDVSRQVVLSAKSDEVWGGLKLGSASSSVNVQLAESTATFVDGQLQAHNHILNVTLLGTRAPGPLQTEIKLTLANGERLIIPVTAYISTDPVP
ncbi:hypothetical protein CCAX7_13780 [Capsulimonas corticalis]|uniref:Uncharacterized protein n=1 Tax=Capsulimonas corticalis TaxID=2219043 RepID=A0A402D6N7_9BACT|nr:hypothetical protein CCAX7_13780 [Capsulimonas corticalis]